MKFQTTLAFTFLLLIAMVGAGTVSALYGFTIGFEALQGVKQPEVNPAQQLVRSRRDPQGEASTGGITLISERDVVVATYDKIHAQEQELKKNKATPTPPKNSFVKLPEETPTAAETVSSFPLRTQAQDMVLEITEAKALGSYWSMDVSLQNNGREATRFLYNFLEVKDQDGRLISAETDGLPSEIPANNQPYTGQIRMPMVLLGDSKKLSLRLSNYPDQVITLEIVDIPVVR